MTEPRLKFCPVLTAAGMARRSEPKIVALGGQSAAEPEALACQTECAWHLPRADAETGQILGGDCALALIPLAQNMQAQATNIVAATLETLLQKLAHVNQAISSTHH